MHVWFSLKKKSEPYAKQSSIFDFFLYGVCKRSAFIVMVRPGVSIGENAFKLLTLMAEY